MMHVVSLVNVEGGSVQISAEWIFGGSNVVGVSSFLVDSGNFCNIKRRRSKLAASAIDVDQK